MGCNTSKGCLINGDENESHYTYTYHKPPPIHRMDSDNTLRPIPTHDMEFQGKRGNDKLPFGSVDFMQREEITYPNLFVEAPSFKDYLISSPDNTDDHITNKIINLDGSSDGGENEEEEEEEENRRIETADYSSVYASAPQSPSPVPIRSEESANKNDDIMGEVCLLPPRVSMEEKSKVKERRWVMVVEKLKHS